MTSAKIRIKVGTMELEYEGDPSFLTGGIETLLTTMGDLSGRVPQEPAPVAAPVIVHGATPATPLGGPTFTTYTIAANLEAKSGPELATCAMAHLELVQGKPSSSRAEILAEMKNAKGYYKASMAGNLSQSIASLVKTKRIHENASDSYSLSASEKKKVEAKVAEIG